MIHETLGCYPLPRIRVTTKKIPILRWSQPLPSSFMMYILDDHSKVTPSLWCFKTTSKFQWKPNTKHIFDYLSGKSSKIVIQDFASRFYFSLHMGEFHPFNSHAKHPFFSGCFSGGKCRIKFIFGIQRHTSQVSAWKAKFQTIISTSSTNVASPNAKHKQHHWYSNIIFKQHHANVTQIPIRTQTFTLELWFILTMREQCPCTTCK